MDQSSADPRGGPGHGCRAGDLHGIEGLRAAFRQDSHQVDDHAGVARRSRHRVRVAQIGLHCMNLANPSERLQVAGEIGAAHPHPDAIAAPR